MNRIEPAQSSLQGRRPLRLATVAVMGVALVGLLSGCGSMTPSENDVSLGGEEVTKLIEGNTFRGVWRRERLLMVFYEDGVVRGTMGLSGADNGTWTVEGDTYCHRWSLYFGGQRRCFKWWRRGNDYLLESVDAFRIPNVTGAVEPGKPDGF